MFAVIEDQQRVLGAQRRDHEIHRRRLFGRVEFHRRGERGRHERRVFDSREVDHPHAVTERADASVRRFEREARLADAARTREGDETNLAQQPPHFREFPFASEKTRELQRKIVARGLTAQRRQRLRFIIGRRNDAIAAALFRQVRRFVGELHHVHRIDVRHGGHRSNAHADRHAAQRRSVVVDVHRFDRGAHALGHDDRVLQVGRRQNGGKLFAAVACEHVVRALHARAKRLRDLLQACIARNVPVAVVECFEVIDVDEHDRKLGLGLDAALPFADDPLVEGAAIGHTGQAIARYEPLQRAVDALLARIVNANGEIKRARLE